MKRRFAVAAIAAALPVLVAACGSSSTSSSSSTSKQNTFVLSEFTIIPPTNALHSGTVTLTANNVGGENHELVIVRAASAGTLPTKPDGSVDEDKISAADKVGEIDNVAARSRKTKQFKFAPGKYVAFCNIVDEMMGSTTSMMGDSGMGHSGAGSGAGHVHFARGMHIEFAVT